VYRSVSQGKAEICLWYFNMCGPSVPLWLKSCVSVVKYHLSSISSIPSSTMSKGDVSSQNYCRRI